MKDYTPNFNDPRVKKRIKRAVGFCCSSLSYDKPRAWARVELDRWFGHSKKGHLSEWLRKRLLVEESARYSKDQGECKKWLLNPEGVRDLCEIYNNYLIVKLPSATQVPVETQIALDWAEEHYGHQIKSGVFEYQDKSHRLWNDLQRIPNDLRRPLFAKHGYEYEYDIQACAPTLISQLARKQGMTRPTPVLGAFLADRQHYRVALAERLGCSHKQSKEILNAIFAGAKLGPGNAIATILNNNCNQLRILRDNLWFCSLRKDIKKCWDVIKVSEGSVRLSSRHKWMIYFQLEKSVMSVVRRELIKEGNRHFLEHDGWRCESYIDPHSLRLSVRKHTGYDIQIDYVRITYTI
jgi:hypothetical protein